MAIADAKKVFRFRVEIEGKDEFYIQEVQKPEVEIEKVEHGATNYNIKTAGGIKVGDAVLKMIKPASTNDSWSWNWLTTAQNMTTGGGGNSLDYKREVIFRELAPDGVTVTDSWLWSGCWVFKVKHADSKRGSQNENSIDEVSLCIDRVQKL